MSTRVHVFNTYYHLPYNIIAKMKTLSNMNEDLGQEGTINLSSLKNIYKPAFEYILNWLNGNIYLPNPDTFLIEIIKMVDFLEISSLVDWITMEIKRDHISRETLILIGEEFPEISYPDLDPVFNAIISNLTTKIDIFTDLPQWIQNRYLEYESTSLPTTTDKSILILLGVKFPAVAIPSAFIPLIPVQTGENSPRILDPREIQYHINQGYPIYRYTETSGPRKGQIHFMTCPSRWAQYIGLFPGHSGRPYCFRNRKDLTNTSLEEIVSPGKKYQVYNSISGYLVFVDVSYNKNYIYTDEYHLIPEINAIVIL